MAGMGKRMRPHTLTVPKPLIPIAGKPIVERLVEDIIKVCNEKVDEIAYIINPAFGTAVEEDLVEIAAKLGAKGRIYYQEEAHGTAHAILCAQPSLNGKIVVAFADTLFKADFKLNSEEQGIIWVKQVEDPRQFGVVELDHNSKITNFYEKPQTFISDLAIIGIYYFKDGEYLKNELQYLIKNEIKDKGEYQLTSALENMKSKGTAFTAEKVTEWLDCGNKTATIQTNQRYLEFIKDQQLVSSQASLKNSIIIQPSFIDEGVNIENSVIGPYVSIGRGTEIKNCRISNSIIQEQANINNLVLADSMIGNFVQITRAATDLNLGDYNTFS